VIFRFVWLNNSLKYLFLCLLGECGQTVLGISKSKLAVSVFVCFVVILGLQPEYINYSNKRNGLPMLVEMYVQI